MLERLFMVLNYYLGEISYLLKVKKQKPDLLT